VNARPIPDDLFQEALSAMERSIYGPRPTSGRRSRKQVAALREFMGLTLENEHPMTVRQLFYRLVSEGVIDKTETEYKATVGRLLTAMRKDGEIPYAWIADHTRWVRRAPSFSSLEDALQLTAETYRRSLWNNQDSYVEIWLEKDALAGVVFEQTAHYDVPLLVTRGYPSLSYLHTAAEAINSQHKPVFIYYFGDHDPSGVDIPRKVESSLREMASEAEIHFEVVAVTPDQIDTFNLPTRPTKKTDTRARKFKGESVEVDAIPPQDLRVLVRECIEGHLDPTLLDATARIEAEERETLEQMLAELE
jgi:hypothetical protein